MAHHNAPFIAGLISDSLMPYVFQLEQLSKNILFDCLTPLAV